ncbi:MAG: 3-phosphoshikimate 1-carboxyvinyltransferase [Sphingobacteriales bacterium]|nr:MAG: 3-phosphoshikimate 1-carboxyvinyltransferase [Sphingobacteriales bacterium]
MRVQIEASRLEGSITIPSSKSAMQRACAAALLNKGTTVIRRPGISNDDRAALSVIRQLGAKLQEINGQILIHSKGLEGIRSAHPGTLNCGESGLSIRMFTPIAALNPNPVIINGEGSLKNRPMHFFEDVLPAIGVAIEATEACIPLHIQGPLNPQTIKVDGSKSSQYITGLIMVYGATVTATTTIEITNLKSRPYVDLTLHIMQHFGMNVPDNQNYERFVFQPVSPQDKKDIHYTVEADWSSASFLLVAAAINGALTVKGLDLESTQADKAILNALAQAGADMSFEEDAIHITATAALKAFEFDATDCPDLFPPLVVLAACCSGTSRIKGVSRLLHKESNRQQSLEQEFTKMGGQVYSEGDYMIIHGGQQLQGTEVSSHNDHRIAMALSIAALKASGTTSITDAAAIKKSYPDFYKDLKKLGAALAVTEV